MHIVYHFSVIGVHRQNLLLT